MKSRAYQSNFPIWSSYKALTELIRAPTRISLASVLTNLIEYFMFFLPNHSLKTKSSRALVESTKKLFVESEVNDVRSWLSK